MAANLKSLEDGLPALTAKLYKFAKRDLAAFENLICSGFALSSCLAMLKLGARGETSKEMENAFNFPSEDKALLSMFETTFKSLNEQKTDIDMLVNNKVFVDSSFNIQEDNLKAISSSFRGSIERLELTPEAGATINKWVNDVTKGFIKDIVVSADLDKKNSPKMILISTVYFSGFWLRPFQYSDTHMDQFYWSEKNKDVVEVKMMGNGYTSYKINLVFLPEIDADAFELPYRGNRFSMIIFLPKTRMGLTRVEENLEKIPAPLKLLKMMTASSCILQVPKFQIESSFDLKDMVPKLGAGKLFSEDADFTGLLKKQTVKKESFFVSAGRQKVIINVQEEGTTASGSSFVQILASNKNHPEPPPDPKLKVDHPFYFQIVDRKTHLILFAGSCVRPLEHESRSQLPDSKMFANFNKKSLIKKT